MQHNHATSTKTISEEMRQCIENCMRCHRSCLETSYHCLSMGGDHAGQEHQGILRNCASICATSAEFMMAGSSLHTKTCSVCAEACEICAEDCAKMEGADEMMLRCAEICRECAATCRGMAAGHRD